MGLYLEHEITLVFSWLQHLDIDDIAWGNGAGRAFIGEFDEKIIIQEVDSVIYKINVGLGLYHDP